ncbi:hypothetical protein UFOVP1082_30 [uncultured Caudovirales phage]|uniref:Uncharacterized protein n=1 Tax=uncultured Caudovirales phage TaxID=2100421 RepID=A0A6J5PD41_9CAUD|nr:hypothetical protein UFOVP906_8 [uncultured Caudovirales phage]CAB4176470.1 hypothetical protein UFOVP992_34 [uncultured Caudovirales phage]CAB4183330.1 hypothetical protein UFOVP1082_30 [uncultured Caudovirales phage]CAB4197314.1 hypothetical protein UFOVP1322_15 [uncultured Caudovirales phage]CAB4212705.1 hypothetical protein UFOVP1434_37 [uncultured Caudovirales phage]
MKITKLSKLTGKVHSLDLPITMEQMNRWLGGELIQNVFPDLSIDEREFLISGSTNEEWTKIFEGEENE